MVWYYSWKRLQKAGSVWRFLVRAGGVSLLVLLLSGLACQKNSTGLEKENIIHNNLHFLRQDGSEIEMGSNYAICCGVWERGSLEKQTFKIMFYDPKWQKSGWKLFILLEQATTDTNYQLPTPPAGEAPVSLLVYDKLQRNELSSDQEGSRGIITIRTLRTEIPLRAKIEIDAWLGSEYSYGPPVRVTGTFECTIYHNLARFGCNFGF